MKRTQWAGCSGTGYEQKGRKKEKAPQGRDGKMVLASENSSSHVSQCVCVCASPRQSAPLSCQRAERKKENRQPKIGRPKNSIFKFFSLGILQQRGVL